MAEPAAGRGAMARGGIFGFLGAATSAVLGFLTTVLITRLLGSDGAGVVMQATAVFAIVVALSKVGMDSTAIFLLPRINIDAPERIRSYLMLMAGMAFGVSLVAALALNLVAGWVWAAAGGGLDRAIGAIAWFLPAHALLLVCSAALRALGGMREYVLTQNVFLPLLRPVVIVAAVTVVASPFVVTLAWAAPIVVVLLASLLLLVRKVKQLPSAGASQGPNREEAHRVLRFAAPRTLAAGLEQAIVWLDVLIVGMLVGNAAAGIYAGAGRFIQAGMVVDTALRVVVSPKLSALVHERKLGELLRIHTTATIWLILFALPIYVLMAVFAPTLISLLGADFLSGAPVLLILSIGAGATFLAGNIHTLLIMSGHSGWAAVNKVAVLVVNVVGNLLLVPRIGIVGAAVTWMACMILDALLATGEVKHFLGVVLPWSVFLTPLAVVAVTVALPALAVVWTLGQGIGPFAVASAISVALFCVGCYALRQRLHLNDWSR